MSKDEGAESTGQFLVGYKSKLYTFDTDMQVARIADGFASVGAGGTIALGSLYATRMMKDPIARLRNALEAAAHFSASVRGPFSFVATNEAGYLTKFIPPVVQPKPLLKRSNAKRK